MKTLARTPCTAEIRRRLRAVHPESARRWGRMSAHQMVCHLSDSFRMMMGQKPVSDTVAWLPRPLMTWVALYLPVSWPAGILTSPEIDQRYGGTRPIDFAADLAELETLLDLVTTGERRFDGHRHPVFGTMSHAAWLRWAYLHMDHHLRQFGA
jgi:hypothetical protein